MSDYKTDYGRPILVTIVGLFYLLVGLGLAIILAASFLMNIVPDPADWQYDVDFETTRIAGLVVGLIYLIIGIGLIKGIGLFWYLGVIMFFLSACLTVYSVVSADPKPWINLAAAVLDLILLWYMFTPKVKAHFGV